MAQKSIWATPPHPEELNRRAKNSLSDHLGIAFTSFGDDFLTAEMAIDERTLQPMGIMHGGASAALAESVASAAANYCVDQKRYVCVGLELNINHIRSVRSGKISAAAKPFHLGKTTQVWEIKVCDGENRLVSAARLTLIVLEKEIPALKGAGKNK